MLEPRQQNEKNIVHQTHDDGSVKAKQKINLLNLTRQKMRAFFIDIGEKAFHADQVMKWIYGHYFNDFAKMSNLNKSLREKLTQLAIIEAPDVAQTQASKDGTIKWVIQVGQQQIETVYIPEAKRATLCVSSQVGCALACTFCSTAQQGFNRNLCTAEIIGQIWRANKILLRENKPVVTNVVMMGMGEPLLNIHHVVPAMQIMLDDFGFGLSKRRVTLSTSGVVPALDKLGDLIDVALAISLHAPTDDLRDQLVPINKKYNIDILLEAVRGYLQKSNANQGKVTIEYVMLAGINDSENNAHQLVQCLKKTPSKINLIPWNPYPNAIFKCSSNNQIHRFATILIQNGFTTTIRKTRGNDIDAACGQLAGDVIDLTKRRINPANIITMQHV